MGKTFSCIERKQNYRNAFLHTSGPLEEASWRSISSAIWWRTGRAAAARTLPPSWAAAPPRPGISCWAIPWRRPPCSGRRAEVGKTSTCFACRCSQVSFLRKLEMQCCHDLELASTEGVMKCHPYALGKYRKIGACGGRSFYQVYLCKKISFKIIFFPSKHKSTPTTRTYFSTTPAEGGTSG